MVRDILLLGDARLYQPSAPVAPGEYASLRPLVDDLHDTLMQFRAQYGAGRAIAAPQIGDFRRVIYFNTGEPLAIVNPVLTPLSDETIEVLDDCMSFPGLFVKVRRFRKIHLAFYDWLRGQPAEMEFANDLSELMQHEYDHLDGVVATMRAIDNRSFYAFKP